MKCFLLHSSWQYSLQFLSEIKQYQILLVIFTVKNIHSYSMPEHFFFLIWYLQLPLSNQYSLVWFNDGKAQPLFFKTLGSLGKALKQNSKYLDIPNAPLIQYHDLIHQRRLVLCPGAFWGREETHSGLLPQKLCLSLSTFPPAVLLLEGNSP